MFNLIITLVLGALAGFVGSKLFSGAGKGILIDCLIGIVGGWLGSFVFGLIGLGASSAIGGFIVAVIGSILLLWILSKVLNK